MKRKATIYGVRIGNTYHYIGKTNEEPNAKGKLNNSDACRQYSNDSIREVFVNNQNTEVIPLKTCEEQDWYDEKLDVVLNKYRDEHPLLNAQWMLEGKRGYWQGKERDAHTVQRLSESKFKKVLQYDKQGNLVKVWKSGKDIAENVFGDYNVVNGAGKTRLYDVLNARTLKGRLRHNYYWFWEKVLIKTFGQIPRKLNIEAIKSTEQEIVRQRMKIIRSHTVETRQSKYTVIHHDLDGSIITKYDNVEHAAYELKISVKNVRLLCRGILVNYNYNLKYGEKVLQQIIENKYPKYIAKRIKSTILKVSKAKPRFSTRTTYTVN